MKHGFPDVAAVFFVVNGCKALPNGKVFDFLRDAFKDDGFVGMLGADRAVGVSSNVFCFASIWAGAEPERVFPPDSPDQHEMRAAVGARGGYPIIVRFFQALESPAPRF